MSKVREFHRRFEVQIANTISALGGRDRQGRWDFVYGFHTEADANAAAERLSEEHRWVRVVDTFEEGE